MSCVHGDYIVTRCGEVMLTHAYGPWNAECVDNFVMDYRSKSMAMHGTKWSDIIIVKGESLLIPEAELKLHERISAVHHLGLCHSALVIGASTVKSTSRMQMDRIFSKTGLEYAIFELYEQAKAWILQAGYQFDERAAQGHFDSLNVYT